MEKHLGISERCDTMTQGDVLYTLLIRSHNVCRQRHMGIGSKVLLDVNDLL